MFISYAREDADWARTLADRLCDHGLKPFFDEWSLLPGDVVVHQLDQAIRRSTSGIAVVSRASARSPRALDEYAALVEASAERELRFIPVLLGDVDLPPFAANRVWRDFRSVGGRDWEDKVGELAAAILTPVSAPPRAPGKAVAEENLKAALPSPARPVTEPDQHTIVVCYAAADAEYGGQLADQLRRAGLPVWSVGDLLPGDAQFWKIRQQLTYAVAVVVLMSPQSQDSDDITRMILEGMLRGRPFFPILLHGDRNYHLANTWYVDARDGRLLGDGEVGMLRRLHEAEADGRPLEAAAVLPAPLERPPVPAVRVPVATSLDRLDGYLGEGRYEHADLQTTAILLEASDRLDEGWMRAPHAARLPGRLLAGIDAVWSRHTHQRQGFLAQRSLAQVHDRRHSRFLPLSMALGWRNSAEDLMPRLYHDFADRAGPGKRAGFFPTLRNPQNERFLDWYDQWTATVLAVHVRLGEWGDSQ
ncbi:toll/interleukin-1 receptor domain-containing protein [Wenjunlia tyrosinilytica]|uniref:toll/interleukin-1 receptor domain-containing protein n=1 Tax=Wenjunlia tyrosinilytica TaxID=1544741 RepID=UPI0027E444CA|nr:toll/interleukin-1 receptor domain-containing protein [Wenjunlia tyrosinilytica]